MTIFFKSTLKFVQSRTERPPAWSTIYRSHPLSIDTISCLIYSTHRARVKEWKTQRGKFSCRLQFSSVAQSCLTLCDPMNCSMPGLPVHHQLLEFTQIHAHQIGVMPIKSVMPSSQPILCCPLLLLPPIPPSIRVFSNESTLHMRWPCWVSVSASVLPMNTQWWTLISFRMDWLDLLAVHVLPHKKKILKKLLPLMRVHFILFFFSPKVCITVLDVSLNVWHFNHIVLNEYPSKKTQL